MAGIPTGKGRLVNNSWKCFRVGQFHGEESHQMKVSFFWVRACVCVYVSIVVYIFTFIIIISTKNDGVQSSS